MNQAALGASELAVLEPHGVLTARVRLAAGIIAAPVFTALFSLATWLKRDYEWLRYPISSLSIGRDGWLQTTNFLITGALVATCGLGMHSAGEKVSPWTWRLVFLSGIGMVGAGIFTSDPVFGFPPELPLKVAQFSTRGHQHDLWSILFFGCLPAAAVSEARFARQNRDRLTLVVSSAAVLAMVALFLLTTVGFRQVEPLVQVAGLLQRATVLVGMAWLAWLAWRTIRSLE